MHFWKHRTKLFARWLHGTCVEAPPQKIQSEDEPFVFSYFMDISANPDILSLVYDIQNKVVGTITNVTRYLMHWKRYRGVWKVDKVSIRIWFVRWKRFKSLFWTQTHKRTDMSSVMY